MKHNVLPLFSQPLFTTETKLYNDELNFIETELKKEKISHSEINKLSEDPIKNKFHTGLENILQKDQYKNLKKVIIDSIKLFNDSYLRYDTNFVIIKSWVASSPFDSSCEIHRHNNSFLSGVIYIKANENSGDIEFENFNHRDILIYPRNDNTLYNVERYWVKPKPGLLLLFPSNMYHRVHKNKSGEDRVSVSFDIMPTYFINKFKNETQIN